MPAALAAVSVTWTELMPSETEPKAAARARLRAAVLETHENLLSWKLQGVVLARA